MVGKKLTIYLLKCDSWLSNCIECRRYLGKNLRGLASLKRLLMVFFLRYGLKVDFKGHEGLLIDVFCSWVLGMWIFLCFFLSYFLFMFFFPIDFFLFLWVCSTLEGPVFVFLFSYRLFIVERKFFSSKRRGIVPPFVFSMARWA